MQVRRYTAARESPEARSVSAAAATVIRTWPDIIREPSVEKLPQNKHFVLVLFLLPDWLRPVVARRYGVSRSISGLAFGFKRRSAMKDQD